MLKSNKKKNKIHSTLGSRVIKKKKRITCARPSHSGMGQPNTGGSANGSPSCGSGVAIDEVYGSLVKGLRV